MGIERAELNACRAGSAREKAPAGERQARPQRFCWAASPTGFLAPQMRSLALATVRARLAAAARAKGSVAAGGSAAAAPAHALVMRTAAPLCGCIHGRALRRDRVDSNGGEQCCNESSNQVDLPGDLCPIELADPIYGQLSGIVTRRGRAVRKYRSRFTRGTVPGPARAD